MNKLNKKDVREIYPLTPMQEGLLFHYLMGSQESDSRQYFEQLCLTITGEIDTDIFTAAWNAVIDNNEVLRSLFRWKEVEKPLRIVLKKHTIQPIVHHLTNEINQKKANLLEKIKINDRNRHFDLNEVPFRITLCKLEEKKFQIIISNHHILYDGWSNGIILKEFFQAYNLLQQGKEPPRLQKAPYKPPTPTSSYEPDEKEYWTRTLSQADSSSGLNVNRIFREDPALGANHIIVLDKPLNRRIEQFTRRYKTTVAALFYSAWAILLQRYSDSTDVRFGITLSGRSATESGNQEMVGLFINSLPLRINCSSLTPLSQLPPEINQKLQELLPYQHTALTRIKQYAGMDAKQDLFDSLVVVDNYPLDIAALQQQPLAIESFAIKEMSHYPLTLSISMFKRIELSFNYNETMFSPETIQSLARHFTRILSYMTAHPDERIRDIDLLTTEEREVFLANHSTRDYPLQKTIHQLFRERALQSPDSIALISPEDNAALSYRELDQQSDTLASALMRQGGGPGGIIAIRMPRSTGMIISLLAILKSGAAYLPIDPTLPAKRMQYMLEDSNAHLVLDNTFYRSFKTYKGRCAAPPGKDRNAAYLIYTSGTTGGPRGVLTEHRSAVNVLCWFGEQYRLAPGSRVLQLSNYIFDPSVEQIFSTLIHGATLMLAPGETIPRLDLMRRLIDKQSIGVINFFPQYLDDLLGNQPRLQTLHTVISGGQNLDEAIKNRILAKGYNLYNHYGPTETTVDVLTALCTEHPVTLGKPIANTTCSILDRDGNPVPPGVTGELFISGAGVARGYLNNPQLTAEKFTASGYASGDLVQWLPNGNFLFMGRKDRQVKIRGFRIELQEIQNCLLNHPSVKNTIVIAGKNNTGTQQLYAYIITNPKASPPENLKEYLSQYLPEYMVPGNYIFLDRFPRTAGGKIDPHALPQPLQQETQTFVPPRDEMETALAEIWSQVLAITKPIGIDDDFFQLGGHSLNATRIVTRIHKVLSLQLPLPQLFAAPTIRGLATYLKQASSHSFSSIPSAPEKEYYSLSSAQNRLYTLQHMDIHNHIGVSYNLPVVMLVQGNIDAAKIEKTFRLLILRHESFRTSFHLIDEEPVQKISASVPFQLERIQSRTAIFEPRTIRKFVRPFELSHAPLLRVALAGFQGQVQALIIDMHHIISDGASAAILVREFMALYRDKKLPPLRLRFRDYTLWRQSPQQQDKIRPQKEFWSKIFATIPSPINLPCDYARPPEKTFYGGKYQFSIPQQQVQTLKELMHKYDVTLFMLLNALYTIMLAKVSGSHDMVIGTGIQGREHEDLHTITGMFVNTLALRYRPQPQKTFPDFLKEVRLHTLDAFRNREYLFQDLICRITLKRNPSRNPLFDVALQLDNIDIPPLKIPGVTLTPFPFDENISKYDLALRAKEEAGELLFTFEYSTALFTQPTIECFARYFMEVARQVAHFPLKTLEQLQAPSETNQKEITAQLNREFTGAMHQFQQDNPHPVLQDFLYAALEKYSDRVALQYGDRFISYQYLNRPDDQPGNLVDITPGSIIGILTHDRLLLIQSILAILKARCIFVPLDPSLPPARLTAMMQRINLQYLITDRTSTGIPGILLLNPSQLRVSGSYEPDDPIYIYFTSGSTGTPKAILGKNKSLLHFIRWQIETFTPDPGFRVSQLTTPGFDAFLRDLFTPLCSGGTVCIPPDKTIQMESRTLIQWLRQTQIQLVHCVPSLFRLINNDSLAHQPLKHLRHILLSGERLHPHELASWYDRAGKTTSISNLYGPSESTMIKTHYPVTPEDTRRDRIPAGQAINGAQLVVLDPQMKPCPALVSGEIYIRTPFGSHGYLDDPQNSSTIALPTPFSDQHVDGDLLWKTGDLGFMRADGNLDLLGRLDRQVKLRGVRIEPGEIEAVICKHPQIKEAAVIKKTLSHDKELLFAFYAARTQAEPIGLDDHLFTHLPGYMIPANLIRLETLPKTPNGKTDYRNLQQYPVTLAGVIPETPTTLTPLEEQIMGIWLEVLKLPDLLPGNRGFFEVGGNSLHIMTMISKIHSQLHVKLTPAELFKYDTLQTQAALIREKKQLSQPQYLPIPTAPEQDYYPLSAAQNRLFLLQELVPESRAYNMSYLFQVQGTLHEEKVADIFRYLIQRHESFRTAFYIIEGQPCQKIFHDVSFELERIDVGSAPLEPAFILSLSRPFDLSRAPLLRVTLVHSQNHVTALFIEMHHIVSDGASSAILIQEFMDLYRDKKLTPLKVRYRDFSYWQQEPGQQEKIQRQKEFWLEIFSSPCRPINLPCDFARSAEKSFHGSNYQFRGPLRPLKELLQKHDVTLFMLLIAIYNIMLAKVSGSRDIVIGTGILGREHEDLHAITGMFVNTLPLRFAPEPEKKFSTFLEQVRRHTIEAFNNPEYQLQDLVDSLGIERDPSRNPLFDVSLQLNNIHIPTFNIPGVTLTPVYFDRNISKFDLTLWVNEQGENLLFTFEYSSALFTEPTIACFARYFNQILQQVIIDPSQTLAQLQAPSESNIQELLNRLNRKIDVDERKLPKRTPPELDTSPVTRVTFNPLEEKIIAVWQDVLTLPRLEPGERNFFQVGGNSLHVMTLISKIHHQLDVKLTLAEIFKNLTIKKQAALIREKNLPSQPKYESIPTAPQQQYYPLSAAQKRLFLLHRLDPESTAYNMPYLFQLHGTVVKEKLENVFRQLIQRHESFRTSFHLLENEPVQQIHQEVFFKLHSTGRQAQAFNLSTPPLLFVALYPGPDRTSLLAIDMHHIISDGVSLGILAKEFMQLYNRESLPVAGLSYKDFACMQHSSEYREKLQHQETFWLQKYKAPIGQLELPLDFPRPLVRDNTGQTFSRTLSASLSDSLNRLAVEQGATLYMVMLTAYLILLSRLSGEPEVISIGTPVAGREHNQLQPIIGMFVNTLPLLLEPNSGNTFTQALQNVKQETLQAFENQDYPFEDLVEKKKIAGDTGRNPIFDVMFMLNNMEIPELNIPGLRLQPVAFEKGISKFDLTLSVVEQDRQLEITFEYADSLFKEQTISQFCLYLQQLLTRIVENSGSELRHLEIITPSQRQTILGLFNGSINESFPPLTVTEMIAQQVSRTPDRVAITAFKRGMQISLTYKELNQRALRLADIIQSQGGARHGIVALAISRSVEMMVAILAILKTSCAYLPIDPLYPKERILYLLKDSGSTILLVETLLADTYASLFPGHTISVNEETLNNDKNIRPIVNVHTGMGLYVIYTSGSTGTPKGVIVKNSSFVNLLQWYCRHFQFNRDDRMILMASTSFDLAQKNLFSMLTIGGHLVLPKPGMFEYNHISSLISSWHITLMNCAPSVFYPLVELNKENRFNLLNSLRYLFLGGESIKKEKLNPWALSCDCKIVNTYGPTECTDIATAYTIPNQEFSSPGAIPIGCPIHNVNVYIINKYNHLQPPGITGEIAVTGKGVSPGYLDNPQLTAEKFDRKTYLTGDLGKWLPNGNIVFLGRIDHQVKIRGFRIEPAEIENRLMELNSVKEAVVIARENNSAESLLYAYIVADSQELSPGELNQYLIQTLPIYMVPSHFFFLDQIPLTPNGKTDRNALPTEATQTSQSLQHPRNSLEQKIQEIWAQVLHIPREEISIDANFFDIEGGHSLSAAIMTAKIQQNLDISIPLLDIFNHPTIKEIALRLNRRITTAVESLPTSIIEPVELREYYPLSHAQKRMYALQQMEPSGTVYNITQMLQVEGSINKKRLEDTFKTLIQQHAVLRTSFHIIDDQPVQQIHPQVPFNISYHSHREVETLIRPFDLSQAPMLHVEIVNTAHNHHLLIVDIHHIISDGISGQILTREFIQAYSPIANPQNTYHRRFEDWIQYYDYCMWLEQPDQKEALKQQKQYWVDQFQKDIPLLDLPLDFQRPHVLEFKGASISFSIPRQLTHSIKQWARKQGATLYMALFSLFFIFLSKITNQQDIVIGTPTTGRPHALLENIIGMFVDTLPLRNTISVHNSASTFLSQIKTSCLDAFQNQTYPFEELVELVYAGKKRDLRRNPLFEVMLVLQNYQDEIGQVFYMEELKLTNCPPPKTNIAKFDLTLIVVEKDRQLTCTFQYRTSLFKEETIQRFRHYFLELIGNVIADPQQPIRSFELLTLSLKQQLQQEFNNTEADFPIGKTLHGLFLEQLERTPHALAIIFNNHQITYKHLNHLADDLAAQFPGQGNIIAINLLPSIDIAVAILAVLKSGNAYLPIDPTYPQSRKEFMLNDSNATLTVTSNAPRQFLIAGAIHESHRPRVMPTNPGNPAYIIYTSGSTGRPKGVIVEHRSIVNTLMWRCREYNMTAGDRTLQMFSFSFDGSLTSFFTPLLSGAPQVLSRDGNDVRAIQALIIKHAITSFICIPSLYDVLLELLQAPEMNSLKTIALGGEALKPDLVEKSKAKTKNLEIINEYGPTESSVVATVSRNIQPGATITIGKPIANTVIHILDSFLCMQPIGIAGQICISGIGIAGGYLNQPELTRERFISMPPAAKTLFEKTGSNAKTYLSGDLGKWLPDGNIQFLGRIDQQVKIRGFRIEPGEIQYHLQTHPHVQQAAVIARSLQNGESYLCAYVQAQSPYAPTDHQLNLYLSERVPHYIVPQYIVMMDSIPLTPNGKLDRNALPPPETISGGQNHNPARTLLEKQLVTIWQEVLYGSHTTNKEEISIDADFFQLGGHSLNATILISRIHKQCDVALPMRDFFKAPSIRGISTYIETAAKQRYKPIEPVLKREYYPLSSAQAQLYVLHREDSIHYNMPSTFLLKGDLDREKLSGIFLQLIDRHQGLRTSFQTVNGQPLQKVHSKISFEVSYLSVSSRAIDPTENFVRPFDLARAPLLRVQLIKQEEGVHILMVDMHHIITDGTSVGIMVREFMTLYSGETLPQLTLHYKDYAQWRQKPAQQQQIKRQEDYWLTRFSGALPQLKLPTDFPRRENTGFEGGSVTFELNCDDTLHLKELAFEQGGTLYSILLTVYYVLLYKLSGQPDIIVGAPIANRRHPDLEYMIGMFVNTLAMRHFPGGDMPFGQLLHQVGAETLAAQDNQEYPFEMLVNKVIGKKNRDTDRNPLFDVMFLLQNMEIQELKITGLQLSPYELPTRVSPFDLILLAHEISDFSRRRRATGGLSLRFLYRSALFKEETIMRFSNYFKEIVHWVLKDKEIKLDDIIIIKELDESNPAFLEENFDDFGF